MCKLVSEGAKHLLSSALRQVNRQLLHEDGSPNRKSFEVSETLESYDAWRIWLNANPHVRSSDWQADLLRRILENGFVEPITNIGVPANEIAFDGKSWREGLSYRGISSRVRAVMLEIARTYYQTDMSNMRIYAAEGITPFALRLRGLFPRFIGSEYTEDPAKREWMYPIPFEDLLSLSHPSNCFDLVSTNEVLEHVPSIDVAMKEVHRVLKPGGWHIGTCPFAFMDETSIVKARLVDGKVDFLSEPEYHGNPMSDQGSLVFEIPGWDIVDRCRSIGFSRSHLRFVASEKHGCIAEHVGGIFVLCCQK